PVRDVQAGDREADDGAVGGQVAVQGSDRAAGDRAREVEVVDVGVRPRRYAGRGGAVLEVEAIGRRSRAEPQAPLFARVGDLQGLDGDAGVVGEAGPPEGGEGSAAKRAEG